MGLSQALYGFFSGDYNLDEMYSTKWKEEIHTPTLNNYFKSVGINGILYYEIKRRRKQIGLQ